VIPAIQRSTNGELVAVASRDTQRARDFAAKLAIPVSYGSYDALLSANDVNAIYIPLPNSLHREWGIKAAEAKKHVLCEKPLAMNSAECAEMDNAARHMGVKLMKAFMYRFHPQTQKVLELLRSGAIGDLRLILVSRGTLEFWPVILISTFAALLGSFIDYALGWKLHDSFCLHISRYRTC
jgi:predicted dehydrogenase